jgi:zinc/manganese transport system substrate-binding protein
MTTTPPAGQRAWSALCGHRTGPRIDFGNEIRCHYEVRVAALLGAAAAVALAGCATGAPASVASGGASHVITVVAAENFWGSIAAQLGGKQVKVTNVIDSPSADPHDYEVTAADAREVADADFVLVNGVGYDAWATQLVAANPSPGRVVLTVGTLVGVPDGGNPHRWYNPADVRAVAAAIVADFTRLDPADAAYFAQQATTFETKSTAAYQSVVADIKAKYAGTPVGASESIFAMLAPALGLDLVTPPGFLRAISEGTDPTAADKTTIDAQIRNHLIKVYVYNSQNATPDVQAQIDAAKAAGIPVTTITETMTPATASWQQWQTAQIVRLRGALAEGTR